MSTRTAFLSQRTGPRESKASTSLPTPESKPPWATSRCALPQDGQVGAESQGLSGGQHWGCLCLCPWPSAPAGPRVPLGAPGLLCWVSSRPGLFRAVHVGSPGWWANCLTLTTSFLLQWGGTGSPRHPPPEPQRPPPALGDPRLAPAWPSLPSRLSSSLEGILPWPHSLRPSQMLLRPQHPPGLLLLPPWPVWASSLHLSAPPPAGLPRAPPAGGLLPTSLNFRGAHRSP